MTTDAAACGNVHAQHEGHGSDLRMCVAGGAVGLTGDLFLRFTVGAAYNTMTGKRPFLKAVLKCNLTF